MVLPASPARAKTNSAGLLGDIRAPNGLRKIVAGLQKRLNILLALALLAMFSLGLPGRENGDVAEGSFVCKGGICREASRLDARKLAMNPGTLGGAHLLQPAGVPGGGMTSAVKGMASAESSSVAAGKGEEAVGGRNAAGALSSVTSSGVGAGMGSEEVKGEVEGDRGEGKAGKGEGGKEGSEAVGEMKGRRGLGDEQLRDEGVQGDLSQRNNKWDKEASEGARDRMSESAGDDWGMTSEGEHRNSSLADNPRNWEPLKEMLNHIAGGPRGTVIWGSASSDYLSLVENWYLSIAQLGYGDRVLVVAEDEGAFEYFRKKWPGMTIRGTDLWDGHVALNTTSSEREHGSPYYHSIVDRRPEYFKVFLSLNVTFLYSDVDIVWVSDPFPFFKGDYDLWIQEDTFTVADETGRFLSTEPGPPLRGLWPHQLCTCFMMVRPTEGSRKLLHRWAEEVQKSVHDSAANVPNQPVFNTVVSEQLTPDDVSIGVLPSGSFPSGCLFFEGREIDFCSTMHEMYWYAVGHNLTAPIVVHNNWVRGGQAKVDSFQQKNLWLHNSSSSANLARSVSQLSALPVSELESRRTLTEILRRVGGVDKTVVVATASSDYLELVENWHMSVSKSGRQENVLLVAEDDEAFAFMQGRWPDHVLKFSDLLPQAAPLNRSDTERGYGSRYFNSVVDRRAKYMSALLQHDVSILYNDVDMVWLSDPFPTFASLDFDVWMMENSDTFEGTRERFPTGKPVVYHKGWPQKASVCFMMVRPTDTAKRLFALWGLEVAAGISQSGGPVLTEEIMNKVLERLPEEQVARLAILPPTSFPSGCLFFPDRYFGCAEQHKRFQAALDAEEFSAPLVVHNNWNGGIEEKLRGFQQAGLWFLSRQRMME